MPYSRRKSNLHIDPIKPLAKIHKPEKPLAYTPGMDLSQHKVHENELFWVNLLANTSLLYKKDLREYLLERIQSENYLDLVDILDNNSYELNSEYKKHIPEFIKSFDFMCNDTFAKSLIQSIGTIKNKPSSSAISSSRLYIIPGLTSTNALLWADRYFEVLLATFNCHRATPLKEFHISFNGSKYDRYGLSNTSAYYMDSSRECFNLLLDSIDVKQQESVILKYMYLSNKQHTFEKYPLLKKYKTLNSLIDDSITIGDLFNLIDNQITSKKIKLKKDAENIDFSTVLSL